MYLKTPRFEFLRRRCVYVVNPWVFVQADLTARFVELVDSCHGEIEEAKRYDHHLS